MTGTAERLRMDVIAQNLFLDATQRRARGRDLRDNIDTVAVLLHHAREPAHLAFDPLQTVEN